MSEHQVKVLIIGSGPAGATAAIYSARAQLQPVMISGNERGGQITISSEVENYPGFPHKILGQELMDLMLQQAENVGTKFVSDLVTSVDFNQRPFICKTVNGDTYHAETIIISTGASARWLGIPSEEKFKGFGVSGCATCDGFFYRNKTVAVVGGGNSATEEACYLATLAAKVYLIVRKDHLRSEKIMQERLFNEPKIEVLWQSAVQEILGVEKPLKSVTGMKVTNLADNSVKELAVDGVFISIGHQPNTQIFVDSGLELDSHGYIITKPGTPITNIPGVFAAGDVQDYTYQQAVTAAASGCKAALDAQRFLDGEDSQPIK